jgi:predicted RND superfamily exporter protein
VVGESKDPAALRRFADDIAPKLEALPEIRWVEYRRTQDFFRDRALYYLDLPDLEEVHARLAARERWEKQRRNPLYIRLEDDAPPSLDFSDLERKYGTRSDQRLAGTGGSYYLDEQAGLVVVMAKPAGNSSDLAYSRKLVDSVQALLAKEDLSRYAPDFQVELTGTFQKKLDQQRQIAGDIAAASTLALLVMLAYLLFHFRSVLSVAFVLVPTFAGLAWTYGFVGIAYGGVNLLTGFLGAILGGLGTEHGIHLLGRYGALRDEGRSSEDATREAFAHTGGSALVSALVASLTFLSLAVSEFRAFREFGLIAAVGMPVLLAAYVLILPAAFGLVARLGVRFRAAPAVPPSRSELARWLPRVYRPAAFVSAVAIAVAVVGVKDTRFDYDFAALEDASLPSFVLDRETNRILGYSQTPVVLLTETAGDEHGAVEALKARKAALGPASTVDFVAALDDLVPDRQPEKREVIGKIDRILARVNPDSLDPATRSRYDELERMVRTEPFGRADLPESIQRQFVGLNKGEAGFVLAFPGVSLSDGQKVRELAKEVRTVKLPSGRTLSASGEAMVLADILEMVTREAPLVLGAAVLSVLLAMWLTLGSLSSALLCLAPTVLSILALVGLMPSLGIQFNYLNMLVIPVLIGTTVDAGVHLLSRLSDREGDFATVYAETGRAIVGGLLTSAVGFGALLLADHPGLESIGKLANLGFAVNLLFMLVSFPAVLLWLRRRSGDTAR